MYLVESLGEFMEDPKNVMKIEQSLYGLKQAAYEWYQLCRAELMDMGFKPLQADPCIFKKGSILIGVYVGDVIIAAPTTGERSVTFGTIPFSKGLSFTASFDHTRRLAKKATMNITNINTLEVGGFHSLVPEARDMAETPNLAASARTQSPEGGQQKSDSNPGSLSLTTRGS